MGGGNPVKQIVSAATDVVTAPTREIARAAGLDGVVGVMQGIKDSAVHVGGEISDFATGEGAKRDAQRAKEAGAAAATAATAAEAENKRQADAAYAESESRRMSAGSKSRTLLTGPSGLEDEEGVTISRKTLAAR